MDAYKPTPRTRLKRLPKRAHYDRATVHAILDAGFVCHVGYAIEGQPYVTPTTYWRHEDRVYWHGSSASRMQKRAAREQVCLTVTLTDGMVLARSGFEHSVNYRSVMVFGQAEVVADAAKTAHLRAMMDQMFPGRWDQLRPITAQEVKATRILSLPLTEASAKISAGPPTDPPEDCAWPVWAGVIPIRLIVGEPVPAPDLAPDLPVPDHAKGYSIG